MAYIGKIPATGNFVKLDAISVVNGQAGYTMQSGSANFTPESANHMLVSLNGVIQAPITSFTVSGSTITFASNLVTGDVIDFIMVYGNVLDIGTPSDNTVSTAKLVDTSVTAGKLATDSVIEAKIQNDAVTTDKINLISTSSTPSLEAKGTSGQTDGYIQLNCEQNSHGIKLKSPPHSAAQSYTLTFPSTAPATDKFLQTNSSGVLSFADAGGGMYEFISTTDVTSGVAQVDFTSFSTDYSDFKIVIQNVHTTTDNQEFKLRFFNNAGSIIDSSIYQWSFDGADTGAFQNDSNGNGTDHAVLGKAVGSATYESASLEVTIYDVHETVDWKHFMFTQTYATTGAEYGYAFGGGFSKYHNSDNYSVSGVRFFWNSGNIASGRFSLYGRKHS